RQERTARACLTGELNLEADLRHPGERLRDRAVLLRGLRRLLERDPVDARDGALDRERDVCDALAGLEGDGRRRAELLRRVAVLREPVRERHRETGGVGGGDQLLGARDAAGVVGRARRPAARPLADRAGRGRDDRAGALHEAPLPAHLCTAFRCHYAITSTRDGSPGTFSSSSTSRSARIETSSWSRVGSRVVSRCNHSPGARSVISTAFSWCLPAKRISSYARPAITGSSRIRVAISPDQGGRP